MLNRSLEAKNKGKELRGQPTRSGLAALAGVEISNSCAHKPAGYGVSIGSHQVAGENSADHYRSRSAAHRQETGPLARRWIFGLQREADV